MTVCVASSRLSSIAVIAKFTVTRSNTNNASALVVDLSSNDVGEATVPATVTIPANQASVSFTITAVDDNLLDETQIATITATAAGYVSGSRNMDVTDFETLSMAINFASISENGGLATGTVTRSNTNNSAPLVVNLGSSETSEATVPATVTIPADQVSVDFAITAVDDTLLDGTQVATIIATAAGYVGGTRNIDVTDFETLSITINFASISENGGTATGTVTRSNTNNSAPLVVNLGSSETSEATVPATVTIPANQASANFAIAAVDDNLLDATQTITITGLATGYINGTNNIDVTDSENISITVTPAFVSENGGTATGTVTRSNTDNSAALVVNLFSNDVSESTVPATVTIAANQASANFIVTAVDDNLLDGTQVVTITGSAAGYVSGSRTVDVTDHETLVVVIAPASISENGGTATGTLTRSNTDNSSALVVSLSSNDVSEATVPATVTIPANQTSVDFTVTAVDDNLLDGTQVTAITASAAGYVTGANNIDIADFETLSIAINFASVSENGGTATGTVTRSNTNNGLPLLVTLSSNDTSEATVPTTVTIAANQTSANFMITAVDDSLLDGTQSVTVTGTAAGYLNGIRSLDVTDIETLSVSIDQASISENSGIATGTVQRNNTNLEAPLTVTLTTSDPSEMTVLVSVTIPADRASATFQIDAVDDALLDGTQTATITASATGYVDGTDTIDVNDSEQLIIAIGATSIGENAKTATGTVTRPNTNLAAALNVTLTSDDTSEAILPSLVTIPANIASVTFLINSVDDLQLDGTQTVTFAASASGYIEGSTTLDITDFEQLAVTIDRSAIAENGGTATGTVSRSNLNDLASQLVVNLSSGDVSEASVPATVVIPANAASATFSITAVDDALLDGTQVSVISVSATGYDGGSASLQVTDHESLTLTFDSTTMSENGGSLIATVSRSNIGDLQQPLTVTLSNSDPTEASIPASVTIPADQASATFAVPAVDDALLDGVRMVTVSATASGYVSDLRSLNVTDYETLSITIDQSAISERGGITTATVRRNNNDLSQTIEITLVSVDPSELSVPTTISILPNQASASFAVSAVDDTLLDGTQIAEIRASTNGYVSASAFLDITDHETLSLALDATSMSEHGGSVSGTVTRNNSDLDQALIVNLTSSDSTEATVAGTVTILANQSSATFSISAVDDILLDGTQSVMVTAAAAGYQSASRPLDVTDFERAAVITSQNSFSVAENSVAVGIVTATDADPPPQDLRFSIKGGSDGARFSIDSQTGALAFLAPPDFELPNDVGADHDYDLQVEVRDVTGLAALQSIQVHVTAVNDRLPQFTSPDNANINENITAVLTVAATDGDLPAQAITLAIAGGADASRFVLDRETRQLSFSQAPDVELPTDENGDNVYEVQLEAVDSQNGRSTQDLRVTVRGVNEAPSLPSPGDQSFQELSPIHLQLAGSDPDRGDQLTYLFVSGSQPGMNLNSTTGELEWTTTETQDGIYSVVFRVRDQGALVSPNRTVNIEVKEANSAPALTSILNRSVSEQSRLDLNLSATDADIVAGIPNTLSFEITAGNQPGMSLDSTTGLFSWTPGESQDGSFVVVFAARDDDTASPPQSLTITVTERNNAPVLTNPGNRSFDEKSEIVFSLSASDSDIVAGNADPISFSFVSGNLPGMSLDRSTGEFRWTPTEKQEGVFTLSFQATDAHDAVSATQMITMTVREQNNPPTLSDPSDQTLDELSSVEFSLAATDEDDVGGIADTWTYAIISAAPAGMNLDTNTGAVDWQPTESQDGEHLIVFQATDSHGAASDPQTVTLTVIEKNEPPVLVAPRAQTVKELEALAFNLDATDSDRIDSVPDTFTYQVVSGNVPGMTLDENTGAFRWTPGDSQGGLHIVVFQATDQAGAHRDPQSVSITVQESNRPPEAIVLSNNDVDENAIGAVIGRFDVTDPDAGQTHSFTVDDPRFEVVDQQLQLKPSIKFDFEAEPSVTIVVTAEDPGTPALSVTETFTLDIQDINDPPSLVELSDQATLENLSGLVIGTLSAEDQDAGQVHTFTTTGARFEITGNTLKLKSEMALSLDDGQETQIEISAEDNGVPPLVFTQTITLGVLANPRPWQNKLKPNDATHDGRVVPIDALNVINLINNPTWLGPGGKLPRSRPADSQLAYYDVNGDGFCTTNDALRIINALNNGVGEGENAVDSAAVLVPVFVVQSETDRMQLAGVDFAFSTTVGPLPDLPNTQPAREVARDGVLDSALFGVEQDFENDHWVDLEMLLDDLADDFCRTPSSA